jgi:hypothetical protein
VEALEFFAAACPAFFKQPKPSGVEVSDSMYSRPIFLLRGCHNNIAQSLDRRHQEFHALPDGHGNASGGNVDSIFGC